MTEQEALRSVVDGGYCIGCGACAALDPRIRMAFDDERRLVAVLPSDQFPNKAAARACPFTGVGPNEDGLSQDLFADADVVTDARIGRHLACFAGWVEEDGLRERGSSGGIGTWLQRELLVTGLVDAVLNVAPSSRQGETPLFSFTVAQTADEVVANAKTRYFPVEMSSVLRYVMDNPGRYVAIGTPCFAKALRLAARQSPELSERLHFVLGIVCGHLKSAAFAEALAWQCGIRPSQLTAVDFRVKLKDRPASRYGVRVDGLVEGEAVSQTRPMKGLVGANWGHGLFKYKACEFCDDVLAETADAVVGDAWLPQYEGDHRGTNVVIVRDRRLLSMLCEARLAGRIKLDALSADDIAASQAGGLRHRRDGLSYRLWLMDQAGHWRPNKRVQPGYRHLSPQLRLIHARRYELGQVSHASFLKAKRAGDINVFLGIIMPMIRRYDLDAHRSITRRLANFVKRSILAGRRSFFAKLPIQVNRRGSNS